MRLYSFLSAICKVIVNRLMKGVGEFRNALALEIYKSVNAFDFTKNTLSASLKATEPIKSLYFSVFISVLRFKIIINLFHHIPLMILPGWGL